MNNWQYMVRQMLLNLNLDGLQYYPFIISIDRCNGSCNIVEDLLCKICVYNKIEDVNLKVFNIIKGINESKVLAKHILHYCRCDLDAR